MRVFEGPGLLLLVFLAVLVSVSEIDASRQPPGVKERYIHFLNQHRDNSNPNTGGRYCNDMMKKRGLTRPNCKQKNSFIHASDNAIKAVCGEKGEPYGNMRLSCDAFRVTTCNMKGGSTRPPCDYRHDNRPRYIVIACEQGYPVHYDEGKVIIDRPKKCKK
ncbi:angiogenin [Anolis carolinensis]|uniref:Ribonuclease A-domain domain-containing protein n=1 Tax=Anolis carolinensis TaxID=28377 RepID=H9GAD8_ANOCA|nr:PREDICTED: angiogenin-like [Anolis carolinensis]|eukprot:XP_003229328.1 PREDICTED: angiogenin-like [Anolis carolinensis]